MEKTVTEDIIELLELGKGSSEIVAMGFKPGTVFGTQRKWRRLKAAKASPTLNPAKRKQVTSDPDQKEVESLKKAVERLRRELTEYEEYVDKIIAELDSSPLIGVKERFKCSSCGSSGLLAVKLRCTQCNSETWWGWHPKQQ